MTESPALPGTPKDRNGRGDVPWSATHSGLTSALESHTFADAARRMLEKCKAILGADAGFVALCRTYEATFEVAVLDPGHLEIDVSAGLPGPLHRLAARAAETGRPVFSNALSRRSAKKPPAAARLRGARSWHRSSLPAGWRGSSV